MIILMIVYIYITYMTVNFKSKIYELVEKNI